MRLTPDALVEKWTIRFAPNDQFRITAGDLQAFVQDVADTFGVVTANVPTWVAGTDYPAGFLIRYSQAGGRESFYYSLLAGVLPHPTYNQSDANWKVVPGPVAEATLYQYITLAEAASIEGNGVIAGRRYGVVGKWNASATDQMVFLDGLENYFRRRGTLLKDDGSQQEVDVNVGAGTYAPATGGVGDGRHDLVTTAGNRYNDLVLERRVTLSQLRRGPNAQALSGQVLQGGTVAVSAPRQGSDADVLAALNTDIATLADPSFYLLRLQTTPTSSTDVAHVLLTVTAA